MKNEMIIEDGILKAYIGRSRCVLIPQGVKKIGGIISEEDSNKRFLRGDPAGYKAFYNNRYAEIVVLSDSVEEIGFKSFEHCNNLKVLVLPPSLRKIDMNALPYSLSTVIFDGNILDLDKIEIVKNMKLDVLHCKDGTLKFNSEFYMDSYHYDGSIDEWQEKMSGHWLSRRAKEIVCSDGTISNYLGE